MAFRTASRMVTIDQDRCSRRGGIVMTTKVKKVLDDALKLSEKDRAKVAAKLLDSLDSEDEGDIEAAWAAEIQKRLDEFDRARSKRFRGGKAWREIVDRLMDQPNLDIHPECYRGSGPGWRMVHGTEPATGIRFLAALRRAILRIVEFPRRWPKYMGRTRFVRIRRFPYVIVYLNTRKSIRILAVAHASRKPGYWKRRFALRPDVGKDVLQKCLRKRLQTWVSGGRFYCLMPPALAGAGPGMSAGDDAARMTLGPFVWGDLQG